MHYIKYGGVNLVTRSYRVTGPGRRDNGVAIAEDYDGHDG